MEPVTSRPLPFLIEDKLKLFRPFLTDSQRKISEQVTGILWPNLNPSITRAAIPKPNPTHSSIPSPGQNNKNQYKEIIKYFYNNIKRTT